MTGVFIPSWINIFRSLFHISLFVTGLVYAFAQPSFLNAEVWVFIYSLVGIVMIFDAVIFIFHKQLKSVNIWPVIYGLDALLISLIMYRTGYVFFGLLSFMWLVHILFAGLQFQYKGSFLQGLWTSCLFTWVHFVSPHFSSLDVRFFALNNVIFLLMAFSAGFMGSLFFPWVFSFRKLYGNIQRSLTHPLRRFRWDVSLDVEDSPALYEPLNVNELVQDAVEDIHLKTKFQSVQCHLSEVSLIFGYRNCLKQVMISLIQWFFHIYSDFQKLKIKTYNDGMWTVIQLEKPGAVQVKEPLQFLSWIQGFKKIQQVLDKHGGKIEFSSRKNSLYVKLPNNGHPAQQVS